MNLSSVAAETLPSLKRVDGRDTLGMSLARKKYSLTSCVSCLAPGRFVPQQQWGNGLSGSGRVQRT